MSGRLDLPQLVRASSTGSLPGDYSEVTARRLGIAAAATGALHLVYLVLYRTVKVLDFGLVKRARGDDGENAPSAAELAATQSQQTGLGQVVGTPAYLAPEGALGEHAVDGRADLYALGCVAYWLLTGTNVFTETSVVGMALAHVTQEPEPPSQRTPLAIDPELERVVLSCLRKDRDQRPASANELRVQLSAITAREPWTHDDAKAWWRHHLDELL